MSCDALGQHSPCSPPPLLPPVIVVFTYSCKYMYMYIVSTYTCILRVRLRLGESEGERLHQQNIIDIDRPLNAHVFTMLHLHACSLQVLSCQSWPWELTDEGCPLKKKYQDISIYDISFLFWLWNINVVRQRLPEYKFIFASPSSFFSLLSKQT